MRSIWNTIREIRWFVVLAALLAIAGIVVALVVPTALAAVVALGAAAIVSILISKE